MKVISKTEEAAKPSSDTVLPIRICKTEEAAKSSSNTVLPIRICKTEKAAKLSSKRFYLYESVITAFMDFEDASLSTNNEVQLAGMHTDLANGYDKLPEYENGYLN
ncbi:11216_t:CDS:2, partial [Gigaspora rosea]